MMSRALMWVVLVSVSSVTWANTYMVSSTADSGAGSLRWAIEQANAHAGVDQVKFAAGMDGQTIKPTTPLPAVNDTYTRITGDIDLDGAPNVFISGELLATSASGILIQEDHCDVMGLAVGNFDVGINLLSASYCWVVGCHVGLNLAGTAAARNGLGDIYVQYGHNNTIGSFYPKDRNVIAVAVGPSDWGICLRSASNNLVRGNYLGLKRNGTSLGGTGGTAIRIEEATEPSTLNQIGARDAAGANVIGRVWQGLCIDAGDENVVEGNLFGLEADGDTVSQITGTCLAIEGGAADNRIGGTARGARNVLAGQAITGVMIVDTGSDHNRVLGNYFGSNRLGTARRPLSLGMSLGSFAGPQTIGGSDPGAANYFTNSNAGGTAKGLRAQVADAGVIRGNRFGLLHDGTGVSGLQTAIAIEGGTQAMVRDNVVTRSSQTGLLAAGAGTLVSAYGNTFQRCNSAVRVKFDATCRLGNLGDASTTNDGGNLFRNTNTWHIRNETAGAVKAEGNDFGTTSGAAIDAKVYDRLDDASLGRVDFDPLIGGVSPTGGTGPIVVRGATAVPTAGGAEIAFSLSAPAEVTVTVLNVAGRPVAAVVQDRATEAGLQRMMWNGRSMAGTRAPAGQYLVRITARNASGAHSSALAALSLRH